MQRIFYYQVIVSQAPLTYQFSEEITLGSIVVVPLRNKEEIGIIWEHVKDFDKNYTVKPINSILHLNSYSKNFLSFLQRFCSYNACQINQALRLLCLKYTIKSQLVATSGGEAELLGQWMKNNKIQQRTVQKQLDCGLIKYVNPKDLHLSFQQHEHLGNITLSKEQQKVADLILSSNQTALLDGVTGSGKTEVYSAVILKALKKGEQALIMLPEIVLASQLIARLKNYFANHKLALWHSELSESERSLSWGQIIQGQAEIIIGTRSALFLPFANLKFIVVDEEHDRSFKQEEGIIYNARDMAVLYGKIHQIKVLLCSATPSLESFANATKGNYQRFELSNLYHQPIPPVTKIVDMRLEKNELISKILKKSIQEVLAKKRQVLLFLNRRGYSTMLLCKGCGNRLSCPHCTFYLVLHQGINKLTCHYCGFHQGVIENCSCGQSFSYYGAGIEKLAEIAKNSFPEAEVGIISSESENWQEIVEDIKSKKIDIIIGTQMIAQGHNFPNLELVGIIDTDGSLSNGDLRAAETCYQIISQTMGRAGRYGQESTIILQTYRPNSLVIRALAQYDRNTFYDLELKARQESSMPPFYRLAAVIVAHIDQEKAKKIAKQCVDLAPPHPLIEVLGPAAAPVFKKNNKYRYRILFKALHKKISLAQYLQPLIAEKGKYIKVDIDPINFG